MVDEPFRLPKSSYEELVKIIKAYGTTDKAVTLPELNQVTGMNATTISSNNAFLKAIGIIEGGQAKKRTTKGHGLAMALQHDLPDQIASNWRDIVLSSEFLQKMITAVSIRGGMEYSALQSHIAYSLGEPKKPDVMAGTSAVIEILKIAGLIADDDGKLTAREAPKFSVSPADSLRESGGKPSESSHPSRKAPAKSMAAHENPGVQIQVQIQVQCSGNELSGLAPKIRGLLKELTEPSGNAHESEGE